MSAKILTKHGGQAFTCDECGKVASVASAAALAPSEWFSLQGFADTQGHTLHACSPNCSASLQTKHKRIK